MLVTAQQKFANHTPRKMRLVADMVRKLPLTQAQDRLKFTSVRAAETLLTLLNQAVANAVNNQKLAVEDLKIKAIDVDEGPKFKRWQAVSRGRAHSIIKRTCHVRITLESHDKKGGKNGTKS